MGYIDKELQYKEHHAVKLSLRTKADCMYITITVGNIYPLVTQITAYHCKLSIFTQSMNL